MQKVLLVLSLILCVAACAAQNKQVVVREENYISDAEKARYRENVVEKRRGENYVSYEYQNVRID